MAQKQFAGLNGFKSALQNVPDSEVNEVVSDFESRGFTVTKTKNPNGIWNVVAEKDDE